MKPVLFVAIFPFRGQHSLEAYPTRCPDYRAYDSLVWLFDKKRQDITLFYLSLHGKT